MNLLFMIGLAYYTLNKFTVKIKENRILKEQLRLIRLGTPPIVWFDFQLFSKSLQNLPPERKYVLVQMTQIKGGPIMSHTDPIVVRYLKYATGDIECPFFVTPGEHFGNYGGDVYKWCDVLPDNFQFPKHI